MTNLYLIRHGEIVCNKEKLFTAQFDAQLTEIGLRQGEYACLYFKDIKIDRLYSSDLKRASDTIKILSESQELKITTDKSLREIDAGKWTKMPFSEIEKLYPKEYNLWVSDVGKAICPNGESVAQLCE